MPFFSKKPPTSIENFTSNYGTINMISFISSVWSRLAYMNDHQYLGHYEKIFGPIIPDDLMKMINTQIIKNGIQGILNDNEMFGLSGLSEKFGLNTFDTKQEYGGKSLQFLPWAQKINQVNGEERITDKIPNCDIDVATNPDNNLVFISIATSNYGEVYVTGDRRMPNLVVVTFRGTYSAKSATSYTKLTSLTPVLTDVREELRTNNNNKETFLYGIDKILLEIIHVLMDAIVRISKIINPDRKNGNTKILTIGHSLGGALATIFAYMYVSHISSLSNFVNLYPNLNVNIGCFSLGSPRVFGKELANIFCCLTNNSQSYSDETQTCKMIIKTEAELGKIIGKITYLRITSYNDPVPAMPKTQMGYVHPCSDVKETGPSRRENTSEDCLVQIANSNSSRCRGTRLAMTYDYKLPLDCVDTKEKRTNSKFRSPILAPNFMGYHTQYLGISFIGGLQISATSILFNEVGRVKNTDLNNNNQTKGDTVCRLVFYPNIKDGNPDTASCAFYDLVPMRSSADGVENNDEAFEIKESKEQGDSLPAINSEEKKVTSSSQSQGLSTRSILGTYGALTGKKVNVPEDIFDSEKIFEEIVRKSGSFEILKVRAPPLVYTYLTQLTLETPDVSFENAAAAAAAGGEKTKKTKKNNKTKKLKRKDTKRKKHIKANKKLKKTKKY